MINPVEGKTILARLRLDGRIMLKNGKNGTGI
jgi:hypothetical protein